MGYKENEIIIYGTLGGGQLRYILASDMRISCVMDGDERRCQVIGIDFAFNFLQL